MIELGCRAKDVVSGLTGIVTARAEYLGGRVSYEITAEEPHKGKPVEIWCLEGRLQRLRTVAEVEAEREPEV